MFRVVTQDNIKGFKNFTYNEIKCKCGGKYCNGYPTGFSYGKKSKGKLKKLLYSSM